MSELNCAAYRDDLLWYAAGQLAGAEHDAVAAHLAACADCQAEVAHWRGVAASLHHAGGAVPPATVTATWANIQAQLPLQPHINGSTPSAPLTGVIHMEFENDARPVTPTKERQPGLAPTPRRTRWFAAVAAVLVVVMGIAVFGVLRVRTNTKSPNAGGSTLPTGSQTPTTNNNWQIYGAVALNGNDAWVVGTSFTGSTQSAALLLHYTNGDWHDVSQNAFPNTRLQAISMLSPSEGWAVGSTSTGATAAPAVPGSTAPASNEVPIILHYSNGQWTKVASPLAAGYLSDVQMVTANEGIATGFSQPNAVVLLHFHNGVWSQDIPAASKANPAYTMTPAGDLWATDTTHIWHYQQGQWQQSWTANRSTGVHLSTIDAVSAHDVWVFDRDASASPQGQFLHYDGTQWKTVAIQGTTLVEAGFINHSNWLISLVGNGNGRTALHLENGQWKVVAVPDTLDNVNDVAATESWSVSIGKDIKVIHYQNGTWS